MTRLMNATIVVCAFLIVSTEVPAAISITQLGSAAPPASLGGMPMTPAIPDPAPLAGFPLVSFAPLTAGKSVLFSTPISHRKIGSGWATWSHGYTGDVYYATFGTV